jgi:hypothetical protein
MAAQSASGSGGLQIRIVQSSGPVHILGTRSGSALTVAVLDGTGNPVPGAAVSFQLPASGPGGAFSNGLTTDVAITGAEGRASASGVRWNRIPGPCDIRVTAAKGALRASIVSPHRLLTSVTESPGAPAGASMDRSRRKIVLVVAGIAAGAVTAGLALGRRVPAGAASASSASVSLSVGVPTITVGGPL